MESEQHLYQLLLQISITILLPSGDQMNKLAIIPNKLDREFKNFLRNLLIFIFLHFHYVAGKKDKTVDIYGNLKISRT